MRAQEDASQQTELPLGKQRQFQLYAAGQTGWYAAWGVRHVLFPWLIVVVLNESADRVGVAQMAVLLPSLFFILVGGAVADRTDLRQLLIRIQWVALVPPLGLALLILAGQMSYPVMIGYGLLLGLCTAFVTPARDALLSRIAGDQVQRAVTIATGLQFGCQIIGITIAGAAVAIGAPALLLIQAGFVAIALLASWRLMPVPSMRDPADNGSALHDIADGLKMAWRTPPILPVILLMIAMGLCFMGWFMVILPITIRDIYGGSSPELATAHSCFMAGTVVATVLILRRGTIRFPGRALTLSLAATALLLLASSVAMPLPAYFACVFLFGILSGVTMAMGRTMVQQAAPVSHRARLLSVYQLGYLGAAPIGSLIVGFLTAALGPQAAIPFPALFLLGAVLLLTPASRLWAQESP
ncbi:MAG TPA: hypothetical protein DDW95_00440 [Alphaproteobacteria bacterium]|nr:hypothetical protein [Alphaproteobacteria bacterium]HBC54421.1 hypothetical protein [Alphaproteobacteria bacterium]HBF96990.1 hypothetical protein [Alphaproteobacteria bacterium]